MKKRREEHENTQRNEEIIKREIVKGERLDKKDLPAMVFSAFLTIFPVCAFLVLGLGLFMLFLFQAL